MARGGIGLGTVLLYAGIGYGIYYVAKHGLPSFLKGSAVGNPVPRPGDANYAAYQACVQSGGLWVMGRCTAGPDYPRADIGMGFGSRQNGGTITLGTRQPNGTIAW